MPQPVHRRTMSFDAYEEGDGLRVVAFLKDERPWQSGPRALLHHMELQVVVRRRGLLITEATAVMHAFPHEECPFIAPKFAELEGLTVGAGFNRALQERFRGVSGCSHLFELSRALGSAVFQSVMSASAQERTHGDETPSPESAPTPEQIERMLAPVRGTCHVWAPGGPAEAKVAAGLSLDRGPYPLPALP